MASALLREALGSPTHPPGVHVPLLVRGSGACSLVCRRRGGAVAGRERPATPWSPVQCYALTLVTLLQIPTKGWRHTNTGSLVLLTLDGRSPRAATCDCESAFDKRSNQRLMNPSAGHPRLMRLSRRGRRGKGAASAVETGLRQSTPALGARCGRSMSRIERSMS